MGGEILVGFGEMAASEKSAVCREGRRVWGGKHEMAGTIDERSFTYGIRTPEEKHDIVAFISYGMHGGIGECFPSDSRMGFRLMLTDCQ